MRAWRQTWLSNVLLLTLALATFASYVLAADTTTKSPCDPRACADNGRYGRAEDGSTMSPEQTYKGTKIRIHTRHEASGAWQASAEFPEVTKQSVSAPGDYATEEAAYGAALSAAMAEVDRSRAGIGKP